MIDYESITGELAHDDEIAMNTQSGSQWDGFNHYADQKTGTYYNNVKHSDTATVQAEANGIHCKYYLCQSSFLPSLIEYLDWCERGIVARGVLLDWPRWLEQKGELPISPVSPHGKSYKVQDRSNIGGNRAYSD